MTPKFQGLGFAVEDPNRSETKERMADLKQCAETFDSIVLGYSSSFVCSILSDNKQSVLPWCHVSFEGCCSLKKIIACIRWVVLWTWQRSCPFTAAVFFSGQVQHSPVPITTIFSTSGPSRFFLLPFNQALFESNHISKRPRNPRECSRYLLTIGKKKFQECLQQLNRRWIKCVTLEGDYFKEDKMLKWDAL